ncbi:MAG: PIN domain-containing protein [Candidatus Micrarchaeota archaeon]|nr:PIN domain-containing protein [Candidatus Micrarchaeota archaeon]MDE1859777.1 PIN domain-containing protein [Candidatus Micrarchaeota archaeon]
MNGDKVFFDTNIICYAYDSSEPEKRKVCERLLEKVFNGDIEGVISNQILGETFNALVTKLGVSPEKARIIVKSLIVSDKWRKLDYTSTTIDHAISNFEKFNAPFWDLLISETMKENGIIEIFTENDKDFDEISGITVTNPLRPLRK